MKHWFSIGTLLAFGLTIQACKTQQPQPSIRTNTVIQVITVTNRVIQGITVTNIINLPSPPPFDYANALNNCDRDIDIKLADLDTQYAIQLEQLQSALQKRGELSQALVIKNEIIRFTFEKRLTQRNLASSPLELTNLQRTHLLSPALVQKQTARSYVQHLEDVRTALTVAGQLGAATVAQKQIDSIRQKYLAANEQ